MGEMIRFAAPVPPCAKPRPRFTSLGRNRFRGARAYMPAAYRLWQAAFRRCVPRGTIEGPCRVVIVFGTRSGRMKPDLDNAAGAVLDALQPDTIPNDRDVVELVARLARTASPSIGVLVEATEVACLAA